MFLSKTEKPLNYYTDSNISFKPATNNTEVSVLDDIGQIKY